jgi:tetratricopeptide (TPR) repeat protein
VNLELARLAARAGDDHAAEEHYRRALEGYWPADGAAQRRGVRIELADYLLTRERPDEARAELIALAAALPENPELYVDAGERLTAAGAYRSARDLFERALRLDPANHRARAGVGRAAFETGEYEAARLHLIRLRRETKELDPPLAALLTLATNVLGTDPDRPRLSTAERARRAAEIVRVTMARVDTCRHERRAEGDHARADALDEASARLADVVPVATQRGLQRDPDTIPEVVDVAFDVARATAEGCGPPSDRDLAILTLARAQPPPEPDAGP